MRGLRLLRFIAEGGSTANLSEVGRRIDVNRVTVMRLLATLEHEGMVERLPQGGHTVGFSFLKLASRVLAANDLTTFARRVLARLSGSLQLSAYLAVPDGGHVLYLLRDMPNDRAGQQHPGRQPRAGAPDHAGADADCAPVAGGAARAAGR